MNLVLDLGNSRFKWAQATEAGLTPGDARPYGEDFALMLHQTFATLHRPTRAVAVSVGLDQHTAILTQWMKTHWSLDLQLLAASPACCGVTNSYEVPAQLGADRWAALIGARARTSTAVCVIDCGTAVTVDALAASGDFRGGVILPGLALLRMSLQQRAQGIRDIEGKAESCLANSTADGVAAGTLFGLAGAIDRCLEEQAAAMQAEPVFFITGGDAPLLQTRLRHATLLMPDLVLEGVAHMARAQSRP